MLFSRAPPRVLLAFTPQGCSKGCTAIHQGSSCMGSSFQWTQSSSEDFWVQWIGFKSFIVGSSLLNYFFPY
ncbi:hypothetical protein AMECASPLE_022514 [Ameca splendens]|uniref:Uncharacterized protein n=1 Tax=Ameca splendens TaxID=208324 RepID=A0ABV0YR01_9TELE